MRRVRLIVSALAVLYVTVQAAPPSKGPTTGETAITDCQIIQQPGSYVLSQNLPGTGGLLSNVGVSDPGDCLLITVSNVSINGKGFTIKGNGQSGDGIRTGSAGAFTTLENIEIRNVRIEDFYDGVALEAAFSVVENVTAFNNDMWGISISTGQGNRVSNCNAVANTRGIRAEMLSIITNNIVGSNSDYGIHVDSGSVVTGNIARGNGVGISVNCASLVQGNVAISNNSLDYEYPLPTGCVLQNNVATPTP